jgi:hypothetical protein
LSSGITQCLRIIKVPLVNKDVGCVRVSNITTIPAFSSEQIPVRITNIIKDKEVIVKPTNIINKHNLLLPRCNITGFRNSVIT